MLLEILKSIFPYLSFILVFITGEFLISFLKIFRLLSKKFGQELNRESNARLKGWIERLVIFLGLAASLPQTLVIFGALKIGTRLDEDKSNRVKSDFFLVGSLVSLMIAMAFYFSWKKLAILLF